MCDADSSADLLAYADVGLSQKLRIEAIDGRFVPRNAAGYVQRFGHQRGPGGAVVEVVWKDDHWEPRPQDDS